MASRYRLVEMIGEGGMARIWRCHDETLDRPVAVKFLFLREDRDQKALVRRFLGEARIAAAVRHPNVVDIIDFGTTDDGRPFMVMELLEGESLEQRICAEPALTLEEMVQIVSRALDGLAAVHKAGIVHRDLKPDNIFLLDDEGEVRPKLLDFGVSRDTDPTSGRRSALTTTDGYLVGTPEYMSSEQARGLKDIDHRTDIYSVGVILYETLVGVLPYDAEAVGDLIIEIAAGGAAPVHTIRPEVGEPISQVIEKAMAVARADRYQSAKEMKAALLAAASESLGLDVRPSLPVVVPARLVMHESGPRKVPSRVGTEDELEMPWGADAVPSFGGPGGDDLPISGERSEPPEPAWVLDTALPPEEETPTGSRAPWLAVLAVALVAGAGVGWLALRDEADPEASTAIPPEVPAEVEDPEPVAHEDPIPPPDVAVEVDVAPVNVTLRGLPARSRVIVDGERVVPNELGMLTIERDGGDHEIRVEAPRRVAWTIVHHADAHAVYDVHLRRRGGGARGNGSAQPSEQEEHTGGVFRDLDY